MKIILQVGLIQMISEFPSWQVCTVSSSVTETLTYTYKLKALIERVIEMTSFAQDSS